MPHRRISAFRPADKKNNRAKPKEGGPLRGNPPPLNPTFSSVFLFAAIFYVALELNLIRFLSRWRRTRLGIISR